MSFLQLAQDRYSVRKFSDRPVAPELLQQVLEAGRLAPTACNNQPQRILVIESEEALAKLKDCTMFHFNAPLCLLICYDKSLSWKRDYDGQDSGEIDASIVTTHLTLAAHELGLGSTWVMYFDPQAVIKAYNVPDNLVPVALLPLGYPAADAHPSRGHADRQDLAATTCYNSF